MLGRGSKIASSPIYLGLTFILLLLFITQASIVISWVNNGHISGSSESVQNTAKSLSVIALIPAIIVFAWTIFTFLCLYTPLKVKPICTAENMSGALSGLVGMAKDAAREAKSKVQKMKSMMPQGMDMKSGMRALMKQRK
jgi:hypothetical protein